MLLNLNTDSADQSSCALSYDEHEHWLQAVWQGYVDPGEAMRGAQAYLQYATQQPSAFLLNNNRNLRGPWFQSLDWLLDVWVPEATRLGLHYVAHIVQADTHLDIFTGRNLQDLPFELQIFQEPADALDWLRWMRDLRLPQGLVPSDAQRSFGNASRPLRPRLD